MRWRAQVVVTGTCHVRMGAVGSDGYGRITIRNREDDARTLTPHQVGARLGYGRSRPARRCCTTARSGCVAAPRRGICGSAPRARTCARRWPGAGRSDPARGGSTSPATPGASRAALRDATDLSPAALAAVIADGDPLRDLHPLFDLPDHPSGTSVSAVAAFPGAGAPGGVLVRAGRRGPVDRDSQTQHFQQASRYRCSAGSTHRRPANRLLRAPARRRTRASGAVSTGQGGVVRGPRGILRIALVAVGVTPGRPGSGSDLSRDEAPIAPGPLPPRRADRRALPTLLRAAAVGRWA